MQKLCKVYYPAEFNSNRVYRHPKFDDDMREILEKSGLGKKFADKFRQKLYFIEKDMHRSTGTRWFEKLKEEEGLFSIKFKMIKNIRIICMFADASKLLLCGFEEKNNKNNSQDSYDKGIEKAIKRKKEIEEGFVLEGEDKSE